MKRHLCTILLFAFLGLGSSFAQEADPFIGGGFEVELVPAFSSTAFGLNLQGGAYELLGPVGLRGNMTLGFVPNFYLDLGLDALIPLLEGDIEPYAGAGLDLTVSPRVGVQLHALLGSEFFVSPQVSLYAETNPGFYVSPASAFSMKLRSGIHLHF